MSRNIVKAPWFVPDYSYYCRSCLNLNSTFRQGFGKYVMIETKPDCRTCCGTGVVPISWTEVMGNDAKTQA